MLPTIGIIPAAGKAERMGGLPKFLLPTPTGTLIGDLYRTMTDAGVDQIMVLTTKEHLVNIEQALPDKAWVLPVQTETMSQTVLHNRYYRDRNVLFGMPDTYFEADYRELLKLMVERKAIAATGCFFIRPDQQGKLGCVTMGEDDCVESVIDKGYRYVLAWGIMTWTPEFWKYIKPDQPHVGYALAEAVTDGHRIPIDIFKSDYYDCGTRDEYFRLCAKWHKEAEKVTA